MPAMIITGVFPDSDTALRAGERAREVAGPRAAIRVLVPGAKGQIIETSVLCDTTSYWQMPVFGLALGVLLSVGLVWYGVSAGDVLLALLASVATGSMLALWLSGEVYPRRIFSMSNHGGYQKSLETILGGRSLVSAVLRDHSHASAVADAFRDSGGNVAQAFVHSRHDPMPLATT